MFFLKVLLPTIFLGGFAANVTGVWMMLARWQKIRRHKITTLLLNLAAADSIYLLLMFITFLELLFRQVLHPFMCKPKFFLDVLSQHVSAWIIVMMSHERYQAMNRPYTYNSKYEKKTGYLLTLMWITGCVVATPIAIFTSAVEDIVPPLEEEWQDNRTIVHCGSTWDPTWKSIYFSSLAIGECLIPVCLMTFFYIGVFYNFLQQIKNPQSTLCHINQQRLSAVLGLIVLGFIISYGPHYASQMINEFHFFKNYRGTLIRLSLVFQVLTYVNSCLNPILYSGFTKKFMLIKDLSNITTQLNPRPNVTLETRRPSPHVESLELSHKNIASLS